MLKLGKLLCLWAERHDAADQPIQLRTDQAAVIPRRPVSIPALLGDQGMVILIARFVLRRAIDELLSVQFVSDVGKPRGQEFTEFENVALPAVFPPLARLHL